ncbi:hypothetical protein [Klebsiella phage vB_Kpn_3]|nr:hypothetical protein [Klebsiella phage vB_Kpn_3]
MMVLQLPEVLMIKYKAFVTRESQTGDSSIKFEGTTLHDTFEAALTEAETHIVSKSCYAHVWEVYMY